MITAGEEALLFDCGGDRLVGILHRPAGPCRTLGVLVVVGGPQYRVGSHRQFVLMARELAEGGYAVLRFDHRGMGDSEGAARSFADLDADVQAALDALHAAVPSMTGSVIFGLCDAASAALICCTRDSRLRGLILANPWVHSEAGEAKAYVRHYYWSRLLQASFWRKVFAGEFDARDSLGDLLRKLRMSVASPAAGVEPDGFRERMLRGLMGFRGRVLLLISGRDLTAAEFMDLSRSDPRWCKAMTRGEVEVRRYDDADHTFSSAVDLAMATRDCASWLNGLLSR